MVENKIKVSVIMPVYKVEEYVGKAIESILFHTFILLLQFFFHKLERRLNHFIHIVVFIFCQPAADQEMLLIS